jgi:hypothetical protein
MNALFRENYSGIFLLQLSCKSVSVLRGYSVGELPLLSSMRLFLKYSCLASFIVKFSNGM